MLPAIAVIIVFVSYLFSRLLELDTYKFPDYFINIQHPHVPNGKQ